MLLVTDLDNTLYDWVAYQARILRVAIAEIRSLTSLDAQAICAQIKSMNQVVGDSERMEVFLRIPAVRQSLRALGIEASTDWSEHTLRRLRKAAGNVELYPGVLETLQYLVGERKVVLVGYTEALADVAMFRLSAAGLSSLFTRVYAIDHRETLKRLEESEFLGYDYRGDVMRDQLRFVPPKERKPNPRLLHDICSHEGLVTNQAIYVGDSLARDMSMAKSAGATAAWAQYGNSHNPKDWRLLVSVTHWTEADVKRDETLRHSFADVKPDLTLSSFRDILAAFRGHRAVGPLSTYRPA